MSPDLDSPDKEDVCSLAERAGVNPAGLTTQYTRRQQLTSFFLYQSLNKSIKKNIIISILMTNSIIRIMIEVI